MLGNGEVLVFDINNHKCKVTIAPPPPCYLLKKLDPRTIKNGLGSKNYDFVIYVVLWNVYFRDLFFSFQWRQCFSRMRTSKLVS